MNDEVKIVIKTYSLSSYLVRAKLYPIERTVDSIRCGSKRCKVCKYITETDTFTSSVKGETYKINHRLEFNDKCLVYLFTCNKCIKQYTGQTTDNLRGRWNNYKSKSKSFRRGGECIQEHLYKHFKREGHTEFLDDVSITFIDKTDGSNPTKRENYWMRNLKAFSPYSLNIVSSLGQGCRVRRDLSLVWDLQDLDFDKHLRHAIWTRFDNS